MPITCECGAALALPNIAATKCGIDFKQISLAAFVDLLDIPTVGTQTPTSLSLRTNICDKSNWTSELSATTPKVTITPELFNTSDTPGDEVTWEGNGGIEEHISTNATVLTTEVRHFLAAQVKKIAELRCLAEAGRLGVWFFDHEGQVIGQEGQVSTAGDAVAPIKVEKIFVADRVFNGRNEPDMHTITIQLPAEWSFDLANEACDKVGGNDQDWRGVDLLS